MLKSLKKIILFLFIGNAVFSQQNTSLIQSKVTYTSIDGYNISNPLAAVYDKNEWLWIIGENKQSSEFVIGDKEMILQRFDGNNFFTQKIPYKSDKKIVKANFFKNAKGNLYLKLWFEEPYKAQLFFIDTNTLQIVKVLDYDKLFAKRVTDIFYNIKNTTRLVITDKGKLLSTELRGLYFKAIDSMSYNLPKEKKNTSLFIDSIYSFGNTSIVKLLSGDFFLINKKGEFLKLLTKDDFIDVNDNHFLPTMVYYNFSLKGEHYFIFNNCKNYVKYNAENQIFEETTKEVKKTKRIYNSASHRNNNRAIYQNKILNGYSLDIYDRNKFSFQFKDSIITSQISITTTRNIDKELVVIYQINLEIYYFKNSKIQTFLKDKSIRAINQLTSNKYLIATDTEGFYEVNTLNKTEKEVKLLKDSKVFPITYPRDIIIKDSKIITNDIESIYIIDKGYNILSSHNSNYPTSEIIQLGDTIFKGGNRGKIFKFNINNKNYIEIGETKQIRVKEFATDGFKLYATTDKGIFIYNKGVYNLYKYDKIVKTEDLLSIAYTKTYGILVTTKYGEIYKLNNHDNSLELFYKDKFKVSIVGIVEDNNKDLWLNTYAGITYYSTKNEKIKKFTKKDGVYGLEGNRYSTFIDKSGNIFIGSYKGLSYFNPKELQENSLKLNPIFSSISSFNKKTNQWETTTEPSKISKQKEVILPASNQRFSTRVSVLGIVNPNDVKYRYRLLDNVNKPNWTRLYKGNEIVYSNLAAGSYILQVEALTLADQKIGKTLELKVISNLLFYKSWWFIFGIILLFSTIIIYIAFQYTKQQKLYASNKIALNEARIKEAMMLEIHHRIKNNLQVVSGLLRLQAMKSDNKELKEKLQDSQNRIESIAGIHDVLYNTENQESIIVKDYFINIINFNKKLFPIQVNFIIEVDNTMLYMDVAIPLALLLNELINNSYKHAFTSSKKPAITVFFSKENDIHLFKYSDNGTFKKKDENRASMGMRIVNMMSSQLKGEIKIKEEKSFNLTLKF